MDVIEILLFEHPGKSEAAQESKDVFASEFQRFPSPDRDRAEEFSNQRRFFPAPVGDIARQPLDRWNPQALDVLVGLHL